MSHEFRFAIVERYLLVNAENNLALELATGAFLDQLERATAGRAKGDVRNASIEVNGSSHTDMGAARSELRELRHRVAEIAAEHHVAILAAGSHPAATQVPAEETPLAPPEAPPPDEDSAHRRENAGRGLLCGLHVHLSLPDADERVDVMLRMAPYLPLIVALSTSSPFWQARPTGVKTWRLANGELPGGGVPELFRSPAEYRAYVAALARAGAIEESMYFGWAIRPAIEGDSLELRAPDACTRIDDAMAIAALYRSLARRLLRDPWLNWDLTPLTRALVVENHWRAQRHGVAGTFVDETHGTIAVPDALDRVVEDIGKDATALSCAAELEHCRTIAASGASADRQLAVYEAVYHETNRSEALRAVTDWIGETTLQ